MKNTTIETTVQLNLCVGCGICKGICPKHSISWVQKDGMYIPNINPGTCVTCGLCAQVCPGLKHRFPRSEAHAAVIGNVLLSCNAWSKDPIIRHNAASGGVISTLVSTLLRTGKYDVAFLVNTYDYHTQLKTVMVTKSDVHHFGTSSFPKSRYLPVSHEAAISFVKKNREKRVIFVGTSCAVRGFLSAVNLLGLNREHYLVLGLFCDRVFTYNVLAYYQSSLFCSNRELVQLHFKNKESGGWPGNMKFFFSDGSSSYYDKFERTKVKDYFMPERCLYCIDKLNVCADISLGDNYTQQASSSLGSNSVIVRTEQGLRIWEEISSELESASVRIDKIQEAQYINWRLNNYHYGKLKEADCTELKSTGFLNEGVYCTQSSKEYRSRLQECLRDIHAGQCFTTKPSILFKRMQQKSNSNTFTRYINRFYIYIRKLFHA